jgi:hypothetical protein
LSYHLIKLGKRFLMIKWFVINQSMVFLVHSL